MDLEKALLERALVGVVPAGDADEAIALGTAWIRAGLGAVEVPVTVSDWPRVLRAWTRVAPPASGAAPLLGVGGLVHRDQLHAARAAGAQFAGSPHTDPALVAETRRAGLVAAPGALTPSEVWTAMEAGADLVRLFPARALGGPEYVRSLVQAMPQARLWVTGEVAAGEIGAHRAAGAQVVSVAAALSSGPDPVRTAPERVARVQAAWGQNSPDPGPAFVLSASRRLTVHRATLRRLPGADHCSLEPLIPGRSGHGVRLRRLLESAGFSPDRPTVVRSRDGFSQEVPGRSLFDAGVLQFALDGAPLAPEQGGPFRLYLVDGSDRCANVKDVVEILQ